MKKLAVAYLPETGEITRVFTCTEANVAERTRSHEMAILVDRDSQVRDTTHKVVDGEIVEKTE